MELHRDFKDLLEAFVRCGVEFAVVGGYAVGHHGKPRATKDLDLLVSGRGDNQRRVASALELFGAPPNVIEAARKQRPTEVVYMGVPPVRVDILRSVDGVETERAIDRAVMVVLGELNVPVIALDDLILNKRAAGRPQDRADAVLLERVRSRHDKDDEQGD